MEMRPKHEKEDPGYVRPDQVCLVKYPEDEQPYFNLPAVRPRSVPPPTPSLGSGGPSSAAAALTRSVSRPPRLETERHAETALGGQHDPEIGSRVWVPRRHQPASGSTASQLPSEGCMVGCRIRVAGSRTS